MPSGSPAPTRRLIKARFLAGLGRRGMIVGAQISAAASRRMAQTQHLNHEPQTAWNTLSSNEL